MIENYRLILNDWTTSDKDINLYNLVMELTEMIPFLDKNYDIRRTEGDTTADKDRFKLIIVLHRGKLYDESYSFSQLKEMDSNSSYKGFAENKSITTWHTNLSRKSEDTDDNNNNVPEDVVVDTDMSHQLDERSQDSNPFYTQRNVEPPETITNSRNASNDTNNPNLSYSETTTKQVKFTKNQHLIKNAIIKDCKQQIDDGMTGIRNSMQTLMREQNEILKSIAANSQTAPPSSPTQIPSATIPH